MKGPSARPSASQVKLAWETMDSPSARKVADAMTAKNFTIDQRTVTRYRNAKWSEPSVKKLGQAVVAVTKKVSKKPIARPEVPKDIAPFIVGRSERMDQLYLRTVTQNQATLQQASLIAGIMVAEELVNRIEHLTIEAPGDVARLLHAITEASQVKHVGGADQPPAADDPRVIDGTVVRNEVSEALSRFRKTAGLTAA